MGENCKRPSSLQNNRTINGIFHSHIRGTASSEAWSYKEKVKTRNRHHKKVSKNRDTTWRNPSWFDERATLPHNMGLNKSCLGSYVQGPSPSKNISLCQGWVIPSPNLCSWASKLLKVYNNNIALFYQLSSSHTKGLFYGSILHLKREIHFSVDQHIGTH